MLGKLVKAMLALTAEKRGLMRLDHVKAVLPTLLVVFALAGAPAWAQAPGPVYYKPYVELRPQNLVQLKSTSNLQAPAYTIAFFIRPMGLSSRTGSILRSSPLPMIRFIDNSTRLHLHWSWGAQPFGDALPLFTWTHVAVVEEKGRFQVYLNGLSLSKDQRGNPQIMDGYFAVGDPAAVGVLANVVYFNRPLSDAEVASLASNTPRWLD